MRTVFRIALLVALSLGLTTLGTLGTLVAGEAPLAPPSPNLAGAINSSADSRAGNAEGFDDISGPAKYDEVVRDLIDQLMSRRKTVKTSNVFKSKKRKDEEEERDAANEKEQFIVNAQDAARKLVSMGKRAVPDLALVFKANYNRPPKELGADKATQVAWYSVWALARIRAFEAAQALMPLILDSRAPQDMRLMAVDAAGWEKSEDGVAVLEKVATSDPDIEMRKHALGQLAMIPEFWGRSETIFLRALYDPNEEIRIQAAKACHYAHRFKSANPKLIDLLEKDPSPTVRLYAMLTLTRLKIVQAEPSIIRILQAPKADEKLRKQALASLVTITDIPFRSVETALEWWEKKGRAEYDEFVNHEKQIDEKIAESEKPAKKTAPKRKSLDDGMPIMGAMGAMGSTGAIEPATPSLKMEPAPKADSAANATPALPNAPNADEVTLEPSSKKELPAKEIPVAATEPEPKPDEKKEPAKTVDPELPDKADLPDAALSPNESSGSQRRRARLKQ